MAVDDPDESTTETSMGTRRIRHVREPVGEQPEHDGAPDTKTPERLPQSESSMATPSGSSGKSDPSIESEPKMESELTNKSEPVNESRSSNESEEGEEKEPAPHSSNAPSTSADQQELHGDLSNPPWHSASRDWNICAVIMVSLASFLVIVLVILDVLKNIMLIGFFGLFITFLLFISGYFLMQSRKLDPFQVAYVGHRRDAEEFTTSFENKLLEQGIEPIEDAPCISGHTFGLLTVVRTMKLPHGEMIEINSFHVTAGFVLGLYILARPHPLSKTSGSSALTILDSMVRKRSRF